MHYICKHENTREMNTRLEQFLNAENISQAQFAESIGVARANISHIIAGRNKPGYDFIERTLKRYPALNIDWLITGRGKMYRTGSDSVRSDSLFTGVEGVPDETEAIFTQTGNQIQPSESGKIISKVIVYYTDNTFKEVF